MKPPCYNRPPTLPGTWEHTGRFKRVPTTRRFWGHVVHSDRKPVLRWRWSPFEDRCTQWDGQGIGPNNECYAEANGFDCRGCMHIPAKAERFLHRKTIGEAIDVSAWDRFVEWVRKSASLAERSVDKLVDNEPLIPIRMITDLEQIDQFSARPWVKLDFAADVEPLFNIEHCDGRPATFNLVHDVDNPNLIQN